jgi:L-seryl-tRNA(Ser) seleniumtransferase
VLHSYEGALWLALSTLAAERGVVVARGQLGLLENGSLADLIVNGGAQLQAVGATNAARAADYERAITETTALVLVSRSDDYHVAGHSEWVHREELVSLCRDRELPLLEALDAGGLDGGLPAVGDECDVASAAASLAAGVDLVILRGDGLLGGPPCGILLGRRDLIQQIRQHPLFAAWQIDALRLAALAETIRANQRSDQPARHAVPLRELLETSVENLQHRAGRLAQQLANVDGILSAEAIPLAGSIAASESPASRLASFGVALTPRDGEMETLVERLRTAPLPVVGRVDQDRLILDLRCVLPDQDRQIVAGVASDPESMPGDAPMSESDQGDPSGWGEAV